MHAASKLKQQTDLRKWAFEYHALPERILNEKAAPAVLLTDDVCNDAEHQTRV